MTLTRGIRFAIGLLISVQLASAFASVALLARMRPAIGRIIENNVYSLEAAEAMLSTLAVSGREPFRGEAAVEFRDAFARAAANITDERETDIIARIERRLDAAFEGDMEARREVARALLDLTEVNRQDLEREDLEAQRLGTGGAWAVVLLALLTLSGGLVVLRRLDRRVLHPLEELHDVAERVQKGDRHRRCKPDLLAASELKEVMDTLNGLVDAQLSVRETPEADDDDRPTILSLLDARAEPTLVIGEKGAVVAANHAGLSALADDDTLRPRLRALLAGEGAEEGQFRLTEVAGGRRHVVSLIRPVED
ncbi:MAG: hypothetical protein AAGA56_29835 [Myxococcota bacterium]